jgi:hypothetical protein
MLRRCVAAERTVVVDDGVDPLQLEVLSELLDEQLLAQVQLRARFRSGASSSASRPLAPARRLERCGAAFLWFFFFRGFSTAAVASSSVAAVDAGCGGDNSSTSCCCCWSCTFAWPERLEFSPDESASASS